MRGSTLIFLSSRRKCEQNNSEPIPNFLLHIWFKVKYCANKHRVHVVNWTLTELKMETVVRYRFLFLGITVLCLSHLLTVIVVRAGRRRCSLRGWTCVISTHYPRVQNPGRFHIGYIRLEKKSYELLFVAAAPRVFSPIWHVASNCLFSVSPSAVCGMSLCYVGHCIRTFCRDF